MKLNQIKFPSTPLQLEHSRQVIKKIKPLCRHLKQLYIEEETALDHANDETIGIVHTFCKLCNKELSEADLRARNKALEKFKKLR